MRINLLPEEGAFYKANLHSHTVLSDGALTAAEAKKAYMEQGYSIMAYTDHRVYANHSELNDKDFVALAAYEVDINEFGTMPWDFSRIKTYHINLYDTDPSQFAEEKSKSILPERRYDDVHYINGFIDKMKDLGFIACFNHPYWSLQNYDDYKNLKGFWGMEIYNHGCEGDGLYGYNPQSYDEMLRLGNKMFCLATDDNHNSHPFGHPLCDSFGGFTMIKAKELNYKNVIDALLKGDFYSSMGPEIKELYIENNKLIIKTSPVEKLYVMMQGRNCYKKLVNQGESFTEAEFELTGKEGYIRVTLQDEKGLRADSNAYFMDDVFKEILKQHN